MNDRITFQRNQPPTEQKIARALVRVLLCVSRNLLERLVRGLGDGEGREGDLLQLERYEPDDGCVGYASQCENGVIFCEPRLALPESNAGEEHP